MYNATKWVHVLDDNVMEKSLANTLKKIKYSCANIKVHVHMYMANAE